MITFIKKHNKIIIYNVLICLLISMISIVNKRVYAIVNGKEEIYYTNAIDTKYFMDQIASEYGFSDYIGNVNHKDDFLMNDTVIEIKALKNVNLTYDGVTKVVETYSNTSLELMKELKLDKNVGGTYYMLADENVFLAEVSDVTFKKVEEKEIVEEKSIVLEPVTVENNTLRVGTSKVTTQGSAKIVKETYFLQFIDGVETVRKLVKADTINEGTASIIEIGTKPRPSLPANYATGDTVWDDLAKCESGGNWAIDTGNGYYGGLQFSAATWRTAARAVGVDAETANLASREEQIRAAEWLVQNTKSGFGQWPSCSTKLGLI